MGEGLNVSGGIKYQAPVQDAGKIENVAGTESKTEAQPQVVVSENIPSASPSGRKLEQGINGTARQAELQSQLAKKTAGESIKSAQKILNNSKLSDDAKISQLQKLIEKSDKAEFAHFMAKHPNFSTAQKELIHSAITESPKIMERVARELNPSEQLTVIMNAVQSPRKGSTEQAEQKRLERFDKGVAEWIANTDVDTLNKALDGRSVDIGVSAKLYAVLSSDPSRLIIHMGYNQAKLLGDHYSVAEEVARLRHGAFNHGIDPSRKDLENFAASLLIQSWERAQRGLGN